MNRIFIEREPIGLFLLFCVPNAPILTKSSYCRRREGEWEDGTEGPRSGGGLRVPSVLTTAQLSPHGRSLQLRLTGLGWHHAATYSEIRDTAALTSLGKPLLCVFRNHTNDRLVHFMNVKIIYSIFVYIFILQIPIIKKTIMILSESYITMKDIAFLPSCVNDDCTQKQKTAWPEFW